MYNVKTLNVGELKIIFNECSSNNFNVITIKSNGDILVMANIADPTKMALDDDVVAYSKPFIIDDLTTGDSNTNENLEKILQIIKTAFMSKKREFHLK